LFFFFFALAMFAYDHAIAWIGLIVGIVNLATMVLIYRSKRELQVIVQNNQATMNTASIFGISNIDAIKMKGGETAFFSLWAGLHMKNLYHRQHLEKKDLLLSALPVFFQMVAWAALLGIGSLQVIE